METDLLDDLNERLFTHYVGGAWRTPLGQVTRPVAGHGRVLGHIVRAAAPDMARAQALRCPTPDLARVRLAKSLAQAAQPLAADLARLAPNMLSAAQLSAIASGMLAPSGPVSPDVRSDPHGFGRWLGQRLQAGMIYGSTAQDALFAIALARLAQRANLPDGSFALLHDPFV